MTNEVWKIERWEWSYLTMSWIPLWDEELGKACRGFYSAGGSKIIDATVNKTSQTTQHFPLATAAVLVGVFAKTPFKRSRPSQQGFNKGVQQKFNTKVQFSSEKKKCVDRIRDCRRSTYSACWHCEYWFKSIFFSTAPLCIRATCVKCFV